MKKQISLIEGALQYLHWYLLETLRDALDINISLCPQIISRECLVSYLETDKRVLAYDVACFNSAESASYHSSVFIATETRGASSNDVVSWNLVIFGWI